MASSSSSSSTRTLSQGYDVFLSFRGEDTRTGFTSHVYDALTRNNITAYKDDKSLEIGNFIAPELLQAIEASEFAIVVLSSNFATSKWCLEELAKIVDCMERNKLKVIPVFYHVHPSDVRRQRNCFEQGFTNHEVDPEIAPQKVEIWRAVFEKVGSLSGLHVTENRNEAEVISDIVKIIVKDTQDTLPVDLSNILVGIESCVDEVKRILRMDSSEVLFIGICGMSGIGKTTLAEAVYKHIKDKFESSCFLENIKEISKQNDSTALRNLQQKLLNEILKERSISVQSVTHGQTLLGTKLRGFKVIIILDDVNHLDQLIYLAGGREWFGPGSRIIITTTNTDLMDSHIVDEIYMCEEMKGVEALRLFCQSAFKQEHPAHGYEKLSDDIVKLAGGLPLALNVYGSLLCRKEESYWKDMLRKLRKYPQKEVLGRLEVVYTRLDRCQRKAFIYIACFLKGRNKDLVEHILNNIGLECGIIDLRNKCLITINLEDSVWMHDLLQQMCWEVLNKESLKYVGEHIAIKFRHDIVHMLSSDSKETQTVEIINQDPYTVEVDYCFIDRTCFSKMTKLKFLKISNVHFSEGRLNYLSNDLRILEWYGCSLKSLPSTFEPKHIYELEMCYSQLKTLWEKDQDLRNLRSINLSFSKDLTKIPDLTSAWNLVKLNLEGCVNLTELHESVLLQKRLRYMNLKGCTHLRSLGRSTMEMEALEALLLSGCSNLDYIPMFGENMNRLEHLFVDGTGIKKLPDNLWQMCDLKKLDVSETSIQEIPSFIHSLGKLRLMCVHRCPLSFKTGGFLYTNLDRLSAGLRELDLSYCNLSEVPNGIGLLHRLINLDLSGNDFVSLPASISLLSNLRMLCLNDCKRLQSLPMLSLAYDYGLQIRFKYYISREGVEVSKRHAISHSSSPTVSCLNCPKLAEDESGSDLAEKILNSYLQLRTNYWITPEAVFEIVGAGSKIPSWFKQVGSDDLILEGPWIGVAICAVVTIHHVDAYLEEAKYLVTAHVRVGEKHWKIPVPINFLVPGLDNQLVFYWTEADDFHRIVSSSRAHNCHFSFSVEPGGDNLQVAKFGVSFIRNEEIQRLKQLESSTILEISKVFLDTLALPTDLQNLLAGETDTDPQNFCSSYVDVLTNSIKKFILDNRKQQNSLDGIHKIIKYLHEVNEEVLSVSREEWRHAQLYPLVYDYYRISHEISELCNDFVRLLKDVSNCWISVKLALEKIVVNGRANDYYTYAEMLQQLNDLESAKNVRFSDSFVISFAHMCKQISYFSTHLIGMMQGNMRFTTFLVLMKVSCVTIAGIFSMVATYMWNSEVLQEMKDTTSNDLGLSLIKGFSRNVGEWSSERGWYSVSKYVNLKFDRELQIWDFNENAILLQELKNKITWSNVTKGNEEVTMIYMDKLVKKIDRLSKTIEDMSSHAYKYSQDLQEAGISFNRFIADGKLQVTKLGFHCKSDEDILQLKRFENPMREAVANLFRATAFLPALHSYIRVFKDDKVISRHHLLKPICRIIKSNIKSIISAQQDPIHDILDIIHCVYMQLPPNTVYTRIKINGYDDWLESWFFAKHYEIGKLLLGFRTSFQRLQAAISEKWATVTSALEQMLLKIRACEYSYEEMLQQLNDVKVVESSGFSDDFVKSFEYVCDEIAALIRIMNSMIYNKQLKAHFLLRLGWRRIHHSKKFLWTEVMKEYGKVYSLAIIGILSIEAAFMGDFKLLQKMHNMKSNSTLLHLIRRFSRKSGKWFDERGCIKKTGELQIWDCYGNEIILQELKNKMAGFSCLTNQAQEEMMIVIRKFKKRGNSLRGTI